MPIERFIWTEHAEERCRQRLFDRSELEHAIRRGHDERRLNYGEADWLVHGLTTDGRGFAVVYDHPVGGDRRATLVVSVWELRTRR